MSESLLVQVLLGLYLGILASLFPALIAFAMGFTFKYVTDVSIPGFGVVVLGGALAGISGGLLGLVDPQVADDWTGIVAVLVILMASLWAHSVGDRLAVATPRRFSLESLRTATLSSEVLDRVDSFGRVRVTVRGEVGDAEGYPPLPEHVREAIRTDSWKLPADRSLPELETLLAEKLREEYELTEVTVTIDGKGHATVAAAPAPAGLSRRVPEGLRAVSIETLLPTGIAREDEVTISLPDGSVTGTVLSARTDEVETPEQDSNPLDTDSDDESAPLEGSHPAEPDRKRTLRTAPTTTGGEGRITIACTREEATRVLSRDSAPTTVQPRETSAEYEAIGVLKRGGNDFAKVTVRAGSPLDGVTLGEAKLRERHAVDVLAVRRPAGAITAPRGTTTVASGDQLIVVGQRPNLQTFEEAVA